MIDLGPHAVFIIAAYLGVVVVTFGLIAGVALTARARRTRLAALEAGRRRGDAA